MSMANVIIARPKNETQENALKAVMEALNIKFEVEKPYGKEFVEKIRKSRKQYDNGQYTVIDKNRINEFLGL
jgi:hypothetical protein